MKWFSKKTSRLRTPLLLQMEAAECGAAALGIVLAHFGRRLSLEELRWQCGVSRDGTKASRIYETAQAQGLEVKAFRTHELARLRSLSCPQIVHWQHEHFLVVEGWDEQRVYVNDPALGHSTFTWYEFSEGFTGVVLTFAPGPRFVRSAPLPPRWQLFRDKLAPVSKPVAWALAAGLASSVLGLAVPFLAIHFVDDFALAAEKSSLWPLALGIGITAVARALFGWIKGEALARATTALSFVEVQRVAERLLRLPLSFFQARSAADLASRVRSAESVALFFVHKTIERILDSATMLLYAVMMWHVSPGLMLLGLGFATFELRLMRALASGRRPGIHRLRRAQSRLVTTLFSGLRSIETLKAQGTEGPFFSRWAGLFTSVLNAGQELATKERQSGLVTNLTRTAATAALLVVGGLELMAGRLTMGELVAAQSLLATLLSASAGSLRLGSLPLATRVDMQRLDDVMSFPEAHESVSQRADDASLTLSDVAFSYQKDGAPQVAHISFSLKSGMWLGLRGPSGSGKSTVARLAAGLYTADDGSVTTAGVIAFVDQTDGIFSGTVRDNVTLWDDNVSEQELHRALSDACFEDILKERPEGLSLYLSEGGIELSGGQRQRLRLARALVKNPQILILDEATSALDAEVERRILANVRARGCACLLVSHRRGALQGCDQVLEMAAGRLIVSEGTHAAVA